MTIVANAVDINSTLTWLGYLCTEESNDFPSIIISKSALVVAADAKRQAAAAIQSHTDVKISETLIGFKADGTTNDNIVLESGSYQPMSVSQAFNDLSDAGVAYIVTETEYKAFQTDNQMFQFIAQFEDASTEEIILSEDIDLATVPNFNGLSMGEDPENAKTLTIDLNGYTLNVGTVDTDNDSIVYHGIYVFSGNLNLTDSSDEGTGTITNIDDFWTNETDGRIVFNGGTYYFGQDGFSGGRFTLNSGSFMYNPGEDDWGWDEAWNDYIPETSAMQPVQLSSGTTCYTVFPTVLESGKTYKQTAEKDGTYYARFAYVRPKESLAKATKAVFSFDYPGCLEQPTCSTTFYYEAMISNGTKFTAPAGCVLFVVTAASEEKDKIANLKGELNIIFPNAL